MKWHDPERETLGENDPRQPGVEPSMLVMATIGSCLVIALVLLIVWVIL
jgi:hypothetical protein